jgi:hypothetical protein
MHPTSAVKPLEKTISRPLNRHPLELGDTQGVGLESEQAELGVLGNGN